MLLMIKGKTKLRIHELSKRITNPTRLNNYHEAEVALGQWEAMVQEFAVTAKANIPDAIQMSSLRQMLPEELDHDIRKFKDEIVDCEELKKYILDQVSQR